MITPPRSVEFLLESFGAPPEFREPLLGDLAEGFAARVEREGMVAARRWYVREGVRAVPHLLLAWARQLGGRGARRLGSLLLASYFFTLMLTFLVMRTALSVTEAFGHQPWVLGAISQTVLVLLGVISNFTAGYIAAWLDDRAPLASAVAMGVAMSGVSLASAAIAGADHWGVAYPLFPATVAFVAPILGGLAHVRGHGRRDVGLIEPTEPARPA